MYRYLSLATAASAVLSVYTQAVGVPLDGPAIPTPRMTQADVTSGVFTLKQLRRRGLEMFTTPFNKHDGRGDGPSGPDPTVFGQRPTTNGTWLRVNGLDSQTCQECHSFVSMATIPPTLGIGGVSGIASTAFPGVTQFDLEDRRPRNEIADVNGRLINPPFLFGAGGVEQAGKEMTRELQALKALAQANPGTSVDLITKGVDFGTITYDTTNGFDLSGVEGIDDDLVVRPFGRKGEFVSVRAFDVGALQFHMGMQAQELVGAGADADGDGVADEVLVGELSVMHIFGTTLERPVQVGWNDPAVVSGAALFSSTGCASCHVPQLETQSRLLDLAYPEVATDPGANVYYTIDLTDKAPGFVANGAGGVTVPLHSDLKRHDMGPGLAETTGSPLDSFFITPRLWGIADTAPYLHDGRALTLREAIEAHGGEGQLAADNFGWLSAAEQDDLLTYLDSLRTPTNPAKGIDQPVRNR
ncbi:MAG: di-heme oxidoredictase family protein [Thiogranum sp.]